MKKPSVFSKDYERVMRKRRKIFVGFYIIAFLIFGYLTSKVVNYDFGKLKSELQLWVGEEDVIDDQTLDVENEEATEISNENDDVKEELNIAEFNIGVGMVKVTYEEVNGERVFKDILENNENYYISIGENKKEAAIIDKEQNLYLIKANGENHNITLSKYIAPNGEVFEKSNVINTYKEYVWTAEAKVISDGVIAYVSNVPYFGYNLNKYITLIDVNNMQHKTLWASKAKEINFREYTANGLEVSLDGNIKYISKNGDLK